MRDPMGLVPPQIKAEYEREEFVEHAARSGRALDNALKQMDPALSVVFVRHGVPEDDLPGGVIAGRWHVRRDNPPPAVPSYIPITQPDGSYRDPDFGVLHELAERDLWRDGGLHKALAKPDRSKARELAQEQRQDVMREDFRAAKRVAGDGGLTKVKWGRKK